MQLRTILVILYLLFVLKCSSQLLEALVATILLPLLVNFTTLCGHSTYTVGGATLFPYLCG